jgi:molybdopterin synthase sulfur carrier subunit
MRWRLFATLAEATGERDILVEVGDGAKLREAFDKLIESHPELRREVLDEDEELSNHVRLLVDGNDPFVNANGWETVLNEDSELALFPPVSGG